MERGVTKEIENPLRKVIASTFFGGKEFIERIKLEYLDQREKNYRDIPALTTLKLFSTDLAGNAEAVKSRTYTIH